MKGISEFCTAEDVSAVLSLSRRRGCRVNLPAPDSIAEVIERNRAAGFHFFDPDAMRFFASRILRPLFSGPGGVYFVTSERFIPSAGPSAKFPRRYTVRRALSSGAIGEPGAFQAEPTARAAKAVAAALASGFAPKGYTLPDTAGGAA